MNTNVITAEERRIYEKVQKAIREERRETIMPLIKQKLLGFSMVVLSIITPIALEGDVTISIFLLPVGIYALFTRKNIMDMED